MKIHKQKRQKIRHIISNNMYMLRFVAKYVPGYLFWMIVEGIIWGAIHSITSVFFIKMLFDQIGKENNFHGSLWVLIYMAFFYLTTYLFHVWYWNIYNPKVNKTLHIKTQKVLFEKARSIELSCYEDPGFYNDFIWAINESDRRMCAIVEDLGKLINRVVSTMAIISLLLTIDVAVVFTISISILVSCIFTIYRQKATLKMREKLFPLERKSFYTGRVFLFPDYAKEIRTSNVSDLLLDKYSCVIADRIKLTKEHGLKLFLTIACHDILRTVSEAVINLILLYRLIVCQTLQLGDFAAANNAVMKLYWQITSLTQHIVKFADHSLYAEKFRRFMEYDIKLTSGNIDPQEMKNIECNKVSFCYGDYKKEAISNISFSIKKGEKVALVGYNGAGKSTLIKVLMRLYDPTDGQILMNNIDIRLYDVNRYRSKIGAVFQDYRIFSATVAENVLGDKYVDTEYKNVTEALKMCGFASRLMSLEKGLHTMLTREFSDDGVNLSGGEAQKIAISRVFAHEYDLIIMDEPSASLDPNAEFHLNRTISAQLEDRTILFTSHRLSTTRMADRIIVLDNGKIVEEGTHDELMKKRGRYFEMFTLQAQKYKT